MASQQANILKSARDLYFEEGLRGVTMRKIAARVGITATAIYRHYRNKDDLLASVTEEGFRIFGSYLYRALAGPSPEERMYLLGEAYIDFALEQPRYYGMIFMAPDVLWTGDIPEPMNHGRATTFQFLVDRVRECMDCALLRRGDPEDVATTIWAHVHGLVSLYLVHRIHVDDSEFRAMFRASSARLMQGLAEMDPGEVNDVNLSRESAV